MGLEWREFDGSMELKPKQRYFVMNGFLFFFSSIQQGNSLIVIPSRLCPLTGFFGPSLIGLFKF